jgi:hypothetical protein
LPATAGFHVLKTTQTSIGKAVDEWAGPVAISLDIESVQARDGLLRPKGFDDLKPFSKVYDYTIELAAGATHLAFPVLNILPRNELHLRLLILIQSFLRLKSYLKPKKKNTLPTHGSLFSSVVVVTPDFLAM